jgi:hypothetical protein
MHSKTRAALFAAPVLLASLIGGASQAVASPAPAPATIIAPTPAPDTVQGFWHTYRENYFKSEDTCNAFGYGATGNRTGTGYVPGTTNWFCWLRGTQTKWSIDLYYEG